jgi:hypothetical protein
VRTAFITPCFDRQSFVLKLLEADKITRKLK